MGTSLGILNTQLIREYLANSNWDHDKFLVTFEAHMNLLFITKVKNLFLLKCSYMPAWLRLQEITGVHFRPMTYFISNDGQSQQKILSIAWFYIAGTMTTSNTQPPHELLKSVQFRRISNNYCTWFTTLALSVASNDTTRSDLLIISH